MRTLSLNKNTTIYVCSKIRNTDDDVAKYNEPVEYNLNLRDNANRFELNKLGVIEDTVKMGIIPIEMLEELHIGDKVYVNNQIPDLWQGYADTADYEISQLPSELNFAYIILRKISPDE